MSNAKDRLRHLVDLAGRNTPDDRQRLVRELSELLLEWPADYPLPMRAHFDRLLEKAAQDVDRQTRATLAERFAAQPDAPVGLLNELFFDAPEAVKGAILRRNALAIDDAPPDKAANRVDEGALIAAARKSCHEELAAQFARTLGVDGVLARRILHEPSGEALAAACKGVHLKRATFSTLALLFAPADGRQNEERLGAYDGVPQQGAENLIRFWRAHAPAAEHGTDTKAA